MTKKPAKPGRKALDRQRKKISRSIAMTPAEWDKLDKLRGRVARGKIIAQKLNLTK